MGRGGRGESEVGIVLGQVQPEEISDFRLDVGNNTRFIHKQDAVVSGDQRLSLDNCRNSHLKLNSKFKHIFKNVS